MTFEGLYISKETEEALDVRPVPDYKMVHKVDFTKEEIDNIRIAISLLTKDARGMTTPLFRALLLGIMRKLDDVNS